MGMKMAGAIDRRVGSDAGDGAVFFSLPGDAGDGWGEAMALADR